MLLQIDYYSLYSIKSSIRPRWICETRLAGKICTVLVVIRLIGFSVAAR